MRISFLAVMLLIGLAVASAQSEPEMDPAIVEARTAAISKTLRCVVCQNQSIDESNAPLAEDMRRLVEKRVLAGDSDAEVREYLRVRYGDYVLMRPPFQTNTLLLWLAPLVLVGAGGYWFIARIRSASTDDKLERAAISDADRARVTAALNDGTDHDEARS